MIMERGGRKNESNSKRENETKRLEKVIAVRSSVIDSYARDTLARCYTRVHGVVQSRGEPRG